MSSIQLNKKTAQVSAYKRSGYWVYRLVVGDGCGKSSNRPFRSPEEAFSAGILSAKRNGATQIRMVGGAV